MATGTTLFRKTVFGRNYRFSGQTLPVIKLSIKSKKNINVNVSSKKTSFLRGLEALTFRLIVMHAMHAATKPPLLAALSSSDTPEIHQAIRSTGLKKINPVDNLALLP